MSNPTQPVSYSGAPLFRNPSLTHAEFCTHWLKNHAPIVTPYFLHRGTILEYTQIHLPESESRTGSPESKKVLLPFDGVAFLKRRDVSDEERTRKQSAFMDGYYRDVIVPDERRFLHEESGSMPARKVHRAVEIPVLEGGPLRWREFALEVGGVEHHCMLEGKAVIDVPDEAWEEWKQ